MTEPMLPGFEPIGEFRDPLDEKFDNLISNPSSFAETIYTSDLRNSIYENYSELSKKSIDELSELIKQDNFYDKILLSYDEFLQTHSKEYYLEDLFNIIWQDLEQINKIRYENINNPRYISEIQVQTVLDIFSFQTGTVRSYVDSMISGKLYSSEKLPGIEKIHFFRNSDHFDPGVRPTLVEFLKESDISTLKYLIKEYPTNSFLITADSLYARKEYTYIDLIWYSKSLGVKVDKWDLLQTFQMHYFSTEQDYNLTVLFMERATRLFKRYFYDSDTKQSEVKRFNKAYDQALKQFTGIHVNDRLAFC